MLDKANVALLEKEIVKDSLIVAYAQISNFQGPLH